MIIDSDAFIEVIDGFLTDLGTSGLVDARKARDQLMDLRLMFMAALAPIQVPDTIETIAPMGEVL